MRRDILEYLKKLGVSEGLGGLFVLESEGGVAAEGGEVPAHTLLHLADVEVHLV